MSLPFQPLDEGVFIYYFIRIMLSRIEFDVNKM